MAKRCRDFSADHSGPVKAKLWDPAFKPLDRASREEGAGLQPHPSDHATAVSGPGRYHRAYRKGGSGLRLSRNRHPAPRALRRSRLKYRCPAAAYRGGRLAGRSAAGFPSPHRRIFTPTPYGSPSWKRGYRRRPALERIYSRLDNDFGFERHFLQPGRAGDTVMMALALAHCSLVGAVPFADTG